MSRGFFIASARKPSDPAGAVKNADRAETRREIRHSETNSGNSELDLALIVRRWPNLPERIHTDMLRTVHKHAAYTWDGRIHRAEGSATDLRDPHRLLRLCWTLQWLHGVAGGQRSRPPSEAISVFNDTARPGHLDLTNTQVRDAHRQLLRRGPSNLRINRRQAKQGYSLSSSTIQPLDQLTQKSETD
jgi:hypothetical protein